MRFFFQILVLSILVVRCPAESDVYSRISAEASAAIEQSGVPSVSLAIVQDGKIWAKAFGKADLKEDRAADITTRYAVGSVSKQFTAAAILLLCEQSKLSLNDPVAKYFPDLTRAGEITIRELLSHTSGYEDYAPQDYLIPEWTKATTPQAVVNHWAKQPLNFDPGTRWQYSNTGYVVAALIVEKASGQTLLSFLQKNIFKPLDMASAGFCDTRSPSDASAYTRYALGPARPIEREAAGWYFGSGELCMTAQDLAKWDLAFLRKQVLSAQSYAEFTHEVLLRNGDHTNYALGLSIGQLKHLIPTFTHSGEVMGFLASNTVFPTREVALVVLSNEVGVSTVFSLADQAAATLLLPAQSEPSSTELSAIRSILIGLQAGRIDQSILTRNAQFYFKTALSDYQASLKPVGQLRDLTRTSESLRGGMIHRGYHATFEQKAVDLNVYLTPDGKYEQFLVEAP